MVAHTCTCIFAPLYRTTPGTVVSVVNSYAATSEYTPAKFVRRVDLPTEGNPEKQGVCSNWNRTNMWVHTYKPNTSISSFSDIEPFSSRSPSTLGLNQFSPQLGQSRFEDANMVGSGFVPLSAGHLSKENA